MAGWEQRVFAAKHKDLQIRRASRSGGVFTAISDMILAQGGIVYGCVMKDVSHAVHIRATNREQRDQMRGSKYIQSDLGNTFLMVRTDLEDGKSVLFSGTGCQVSALKQFLGKPYENLVCMDLVCHGVPSQKVWNQYLRWLEKKHKKVVAVDFRNKKDFGWAGHVETITLRNGDREYKVHSRIFKILFSEHYILRPSCHACPNKSVERPGDLTIADFWGIDKAVPGFNDNQGVSLVLVNTESGSALFSEAVKELDIEEVTLQQGMQPSLKQPFQMPDERDAFWETFHRKGFSDVIKRYTWKPRWKEWKKRLKRSLRRIIPGRKI